MTRIKICGLTRAEDVSYAVELGASAVGFVLEPSSPRFVGLRDIGGLLEIVPPFVTSVGVLGTFQKGHAIGSFAAVQAIGVKLSDLESSQQAICVVRPGSGDAMPEPDECTAILIDSFSTEGFGGTGRKVDLQFAKEVIAESVRPIVVAGGLRPENVAEVIKELRPYAVDISSGVESRPGVKDHGAMRDFFDAVAQADATF